MEGDSRAAEKLHRLRLVLPDLSQSFLGNWLASLDKSIHSELLYDYDGLFNASESTRNDRVNTSRRRPVRTHSKHQSSVHDDAVRDYTVRPTARTGNSPELWLRVGEMPPCGPVLQTWELCHGLETCLLEKASKDSQESASPHTQLGSTLFKSTIDDHQLLDVELSSKSAQRAQSEIVPESDLVRDVLYALQGLPAAVRKLENLSKTYCTTSADKSAHNLSTLWTRSVTAAALGKVLSVVARAGYVRCQLDAFVSFFLDGRLDPYNEKSDEASSLSKKAYKMKKKRLAAEIKEAEKQADSAKCPKNAISSFEKKVPRHCLVNQAFAAAVKGILRGHSAALNTLASAVSIRRGQETGHTSKGTGLREQDPGPVIGYGSRDISLLECYLHTRELRVQLHALAFICLMRGGKSFVGRSISDACSQAVMNTKDRGRTQDPGNGKKSDTSDDWCDPLVRSFDNFPRGADLLSYLYDQLLEMDPLHTELLRFLFERAYEPYSIFIQSWLYQAAVRDPYGEFIIEQADFSAVFSGSMVNGKLVTDPHPMNLKLRSGLYVPQFMENICTPLIRAGEQLQVLLKLAETCELAQQMANHTRTSETFWQQNSTPSSIESSESSLSLPALVFSKRKLDEIAEKREKKSRELRNQFDLLFTELSSRRMTKEKSRASSRSGMPANLSLDISINEVEDNKIPVVEAEPRQQMSQEPVSDFPASQELTDLKHLKTTVILPKRGWVTSAEDEAASEDSLSSSKVKSQSVCQVGDNEILAGLARKEVDETGKMLTSDVPENVSGLQMGYQDQIEAWLRPDLKWSSKGVDSDQGSPQYQSFISSHQRGTSWPLWGLPINPFLVQADVDDFAPNTYVHPSFSGTYQHWDVTAKQAVTSGNSSHSSYLEKSRHSSRHGERNVEPHWFASLELALNDQIFAGLDAQLKLPSWGQADVGHVRDETEQQEPTEYLDQLLLELDTRLTQPLGYTLTDRSEPDVPVSPIISEGSINPLNFSPSVHLEPNAPTTFALPTRLADPQLQAGAAVYLASPQTLTNPPNFSSDSQLESEVLADITSSQGTDVGDLLLQSTQMESQNLSGGSRLFPPHTDFCVEKGPAERWLTERYPFNMDTQESRSVECQRSTREVPGILENPSKISELKITDDASINSGIDSYVSGVDHRKVDHFSEKRNPQQDGRLEGPAKWEQYLKFSDRLSSAAILEVTDYGIGEDEVCVDEEIPLSVVVSKCIAEEILSQYQSISTLTVRLFQEGLCLQDHYNALRRYFFMERGDWAEYFTTALCQHKWGPLGGQRRQMEVQGMLEAAFQRSSCDGDEYAERLYVSFSESTFHCENSIHGSNKTTIPSFVDCSRLDAFDFIALQYRVDWPLCLILTSHSLGLYNVVFNFLMRIKLTVHALGDIWQRLQVIDRSLHKERRSSTFQQQRNRFRTLQQFRQQIYHFVTTVQRYVESKLLNVVWSKFLQDIQSEVNDMQDLEIVHWAYLEDAIQECFLCTKTNGVKRCIDSIMQCVLDFSSHMRNAFYGSGEKHDLIDDGLFMQIHQVKKSFQASLQQLHSYHMKQEPQSRTNLIDLWMILDYNNFLTTALSTARL